MTLVALEQFKNAVPSQIATYIEEQQVKTVGEAAVLADQYVLTHRTDWGTTHAVVGSGGSAGWGTVATGSIRPDVSVTGTRYPDKMCHFCHKKGHVKADCFAFKKKSKPVNVKSAALATSVVKVGSGQPSSQVREEVSIDEAYLPFVSTGFVSLTEQGEKVPVTILRDSAALSSFILSSVLPFSEKSDTGCSELVQGMGLTVVSAPVHCVHLFSDFVQGEVRLVVRPELPVGGVQVILGNRLAEARMWPVVPPQDQSSTPVDCQVPVSKTESPVSSVASDVVSACVVTRAGTSTDGVSDVRNTQDPCLDLSNVPLSVSRAELAAEQQLDSSIKQLLEGVVPIVEVENRAHGYFLQEGVLVRKWVPCGELGMKNPVFQVVVPLKFRHLVLKLSHDDAGHMGVRKTYDRILRYFFWPKLKKDVSEYIKTCHMCQIIGKPNQVVKPAPLHPIPAIGELFEHVIIDCVGPLPPAKSGAKYLLTVMCQATRYPAAYPLRSITTRSVVKALSQFISIFGIPKVVQSDQGSNFSSHMFAQVLKQLGVKHSQSSAYHAQSQGALERFHQTLKSLLRSFCTELGKDWEEGLPWMMLAAREVTQESTGFSPNDLVFAHPVRGPLAVLRDNFVDSDPPKNLVDYVNGFRHICTWQVSVQKRILVWLKRK